MKHIAPYYAFIVLVWIEYVTFGHKPFNIALPRPFAQFAQSLHAVLADLRNMAFMYVFGCYPSSLSGNLFSRPMCADVDGMVVVDVPVFVHPAHYGMEVRYAALGFLTEAYNSVLILV